MAFGDVTHDGREDAVFAAGLDDHACMFVSKAGPAGGYEGMLSTGADPELGWGWSTAVAGDLNGDGLTDFAAKSNNYGVGVYRGLGGGDFQTNPEVLYAGSFASRASRLPRRKTSS